MNKKCSNVSIIKFNAQLWSIGEGGRERNEEKQKDLQFVYDLAWEVFVDEHLSPANYRRERCSYFYN